MKKINNYYIPEEDISSKDIVNDISTRKEFITYKINKNYDFNDFYRFKINYNNLRNNKLILSNTQNFVKNFLNPNTPYKRILIKWNVGLGKTIASLVATNKLFIEKEQLAAVNIAYHN